MLTINTAWKQSSERMERVSVLLLGLLCLHTSSVEGVSEPIEYDNQTLWAGVCNVGNNGRQSPIDIITANVVEDSSLSALVFSPTWGESVSTGVFVNNGHSVQFNPAANSPEVTTEMPVGNYTFLQFHFHWGSGSGSGSEHLINGQQAELEVHFVHTSIGPDDGDPGNDLAVIGVLADVTDTPVSGVWEVLDVTDITNVGANISVSNLALSSLLPANRNYYHYEGSLTTPPCSESVQWFVLKDRITVPSAYLASLRTINSAEGTPLTHNFRMPQSLGSRTVTTPGSSAVVTSSSLLAVLSVALLVIAGLF